MIIFVEVPLSVAKVRPSEEVSTLHYFGLATDVASSSAPSYGDNGTYRKLATSGERIALRGYFFVTLTIEFVTLTCYAKSINSKELKMFKENPKIKSVTSCSSGDFLFVFGLGKDGMMYICNSIQ